MGMRRKSQMMHKEQAIGYLKGYLGKSPHIYVTATRAYSNGMGGYVRIFIPCEYDVVRPDGEKLYIYEISYLAACAIECKYHDDYGVQIGGCGMDRRFEAGYALMLAVFGFPTNVEGAKPYSTHSDLCRFIHRF